MARPAGESANEADSDLSTERILFRWDKPQWNHNAGHIEFGPDGMLYISTGDGGGANDGLCDSPQSHGPTGNGQNIETALGKMIRIDVDSDPLASPGWVQNPANGHWYRLTSPGTWDDAEAEAVNYGGHLVTINDAAENQWVMDNLNLCDEGNISKWIGLYQLPGSTEPADGWVWVSGQTVTFTNWSSGEPNDLGGVEEWAEMRPQCNPLAGSWNDNWPPPLLRGIVERDVGYDVPADNPFVGVAGLDEIFAYGFRNPYRFSFDDAGGDLYVADVGQNIYEEIDLVVNGGNYGWAVYEGAHCFDPPGACAPLPGCGDAGYIDPISEYRHTEGGTAVVGGYVYRGTAYAPLQGRYVYGDFSADFGPTGRLYYMDLSGPHANIRREFVVYPNGNPIGQFLKGFGEDEDGELYVCASGTVGPNGTDGVIYKIAPPPPPTAIWNCPGGDLGNSDCVARTRALTFTADPPAVATGDATTSAIKVTMLDLQNPVPANDVCCPPPDFSAYESASCTTPGEMNSCARWVGPPFTYLEANDLPTHGNFRASRVQCTPYYHDWTAETVINVVGAEILPSSTYALKLYGSSCKGSEDTCANTSPDTLIMTRRAGDIAPVFQNPAAGRSHPNAVDIVGAVNNFKKFVPLGAPKHIEAQVQPNLPSLNKDVDALDIQAVVYNVHLRAYQFSGPCPCPSTVTCNATMCTSDTQCSGGSCTRTCAAGSPREGQPCTANKHCGTCVGGSIPGGPCENDGPCLGGGTCTTGTCSTQGFCRDRCGRCN